MVSILLVLHGPSWKGEMRAWANGNGALEVYCHVDVIFVINYSKAFEYRTYDGKLCFILIMS